jgi:hypothetical protein
MEASPSASHGGMLALGKGELAHEEETSGDFDTKQHQAYGGIDRHARRMDVCILNPAGAIMLHRNRHASPEPFLKAIVPSGAEMVVAVEGLFTWSCLADLCAQEGSPVGLGPVHSMHAIHGGQATHDTIDAHTMAVWLHGSLLPQASVDPAARRVTRELRRRRMSLVCQRAEWLTPVQQPNSQSHRPELGQNMADQAHRHGVAARFPHPAIHKRVAGDLALIGYDDPRLSDLE